MKSALELAMEKSEKLGGARKLTRKQKEEIAEIRKIAESKIAEVSIMMDEKLGKLEGAAGEEAEAVREELNKQLQREKAKIEEGMERKIEKVRNTK